MDSKLYKLIGKAVDKAEKNGGDLTTKNLRYVVKIATDMSAKSGVDFDELFAEGVIAMKKCEAKYDPEKNDNFVKFCASSVRGYMLNVINRQSSLVHIPVNHQKGFKAGQETKSEASKLSYEHIDSFNYDTLGVTDSDAFTTDRYQILLDGVRQLDENSQIAIKMKLRMGEYETLKKNSMQVIAEELEVPVNIASKIYKEAMTKLTKYCRAEICG